MYSSASKAQPMRATDVVVGGDAHHRAALGALCVKLIKRTTNNLAVTPGLHLHHVGNGVGELEYGMTGGLPLIFTQVG